MRHKKGKREIKKGNVINIICAANLEFFKIYEILTRSKNERSFSLLQAYIVVTSTHIISFQPVLSHDFIV